MSPRRPCGFTLIEAMIVVVIVGVLATIAVPSYAVYVTRSRILEGVARLADARARMEEFFLDRRSYLDDAGVCGIPPPSPKAPDNFALSCSATTTTFTYTATGLADKGMAAFAYAIDQSGAKTTVATPRDWVRTGDCWTIRPDGSCV